MLTNRQGAPQIRRRVENRIYCDHVMNSISLDCSVSRIKRGVGGYFMWVGWTEGLGGNMRVLIGDQAGNREAG